MSRPLTIQERAMLDRIRRNDGAPDNTGVSLNDSAVGCVYARRSIEDLPPTLWERAWAGVPLATIVMCFAGAGALIFAAVNGGL